ncbi:MAG: leucine/isoleucine/valine transporter permease subunit [Methanosaeta sp. PtaU1.Bin112]|nr:MAG: leucine/isoleucine/valine transporter permease subunit [Methanosaeta sp. PtaU1.Bin112]
MQDYLVSIILTAGIYAIFALGLNLQWGYAGLLNFGHVAFMAIGAYTTVLLSMNEVPLILAVPAGMVLAGACGAFLGVATLRLREDYLAIVTIGFSEIVRFILLNWSSLTRGSFGLYGYPRPLEEMIPHEDYNLLLAGVVIVVLLLVYALLEILAKSPWGRVLKSVRDDEAVSVSLGKNAFSYKVQSLALGSAIAALAGSMLAFYLQYINPNNFQPIETFYAWIMVILGGSGSNRGTIAGAVLLWGFFSTTRFLEGYVSLSPSASGALRMVIIGLVLIALMMFRPQGLFGRKEELAVGK